MQQLSNTLLFIQCVRKPMLQIIVWWISAELSHIYRKYSSHLSGNVWYFAYGSNVLDANLHKRRIRVLESRRYSLPNYKRVFHHPSPYLKVGFADVVPEVGCEVSGRLLRIPAADALWLHLDELVFPFSRYRIEWLERDQLSLFFYRSNVPTPGLLPSERYLQDIVAGLEALGFSDKHLRSLRAIPTAVPDQRTVNSRYFVKDISQFPIWVQPTLGWYERVSLNLFRNVWSRSLFGHKVISHLPSEQTQSGADT